MVQLAMIHLRQRLCSSAKALAESLEHLAEAERIKPQYRAIARQLAARAAKVTTHAKLNVLSQILKETEDRVVVFSDHRPTVELIEQRVKSGQYHSAEDVVSAAVAQLDQQEQIGDFEPGELDRLLAEKKGSKR